MDAMKPRKIETIRRERFWLGESGVAHDCNVIRHTDFLYLRRVEKAAIALVNEAGEREDIREAFDKLRKALGDEK